MDAMDDEEYGIECICTQRKSEAELALDIVLGAS